MSYSEAKQWDINLGSVNFATAETMTFKVPVGYKAKLREVVVMVTTLCTAVTTEGFLKIGSAENGAQYASCGLGTTADKACYRMSDNTGDLVEDDIPADTSIWLSIVAPTGGSPAGVGFVTISFDLYRM